MKKESKSNRTPFSYTNSYREGYKTNSKTHYSKTSKYGNENLSPSLDQKQEGLSGLSYYQIAKHYEYNLQSRDLNKALHYYYLALDNNDRKDSTIKDLAGVLHQKGRTQEAVDFLTNQRKRYRGDLLKYDNLIENLSRQVQLPSGKNLNKYVLLLNMERESTQDDVKKLFTNSSRILNIKFYKDLSFSKLSSIEYIPCIIVEFATYSAAKKTVDTFQFSKFPYLQLYWVNIYYLIIGEISKGREDPLKLNSFYFGDDKSFNNLLEVISIDSQYLESDFKKHMIEQIWATQKSPEKIVQNTDQYFINRRGFENQAKLQQIRRRKLKVKE